MINVAAHRISTMEIESAAASEPGVAEFAVVGIRDAMRGAVVVAFVTSRPSAAPDDLASGVTAAVEAGIGGIARLSRVHVCAALPKTRAGKIMLCLLREAAETGQVRSDLIGLESSASVEAVLEAVSY